MTPEMKKHLEAVVIATANEQSDEAKSEFSKYLRLKTQAILVGEAEEADDKDDDKDEEKEDKDEKKDDKKSEKKDDKKSDKKEEKKDEKADEEDEEKC